MARLNLLARPLDRFASRSSKRARVRAERLSKSEPERAFALFAAAAESGDAEAAFTVGERYLEGKGLLRHPVEAARWYHRAAEAGHLRAQCRLAQLHLLGLPQAAVGPNAGLFEPVEPGGADYHAAMLWARPAAEAGAPDAQAMLAYILCSGPEGLRDPDAALQWYRKSAEQDCPQGRLGYAIALMLRADTAEKTVAARDELVRAAQAGLPTAHFLLGVGAEDAVGTRMNETEARQHYKIAAEAGLASAQVRLGLMLLQGRGGPADPLNGESWLRRAALGGNREAAALLGDIYARGGDLPPNYVEAAHWFRTAAERGHNAAARALGTLYLTGAGVAQDADEAATWFKRAAEAGDPGAQADLAALMQMGTVSTLAHEPPPVHEWFERAAQQGDLIAAFNYAVCLAEGVGVSRNDERAAFWLKRAAEGVVSAQYWYGRMLAEGRGVAKDDAEAAAWFARAAEAGMAEAQVALAELHMDGRGVPRDHQIAKCWFLRATPAGHAGAMFALGALHGGGHDIETDREEARRWFAQAAEHGHPIAALMLARYAVRGLGGPRDIEAGRRWYAQAASLGAAEAADESPRSTRRWRRMPGPQKWSRRLIDVEGPMEPVFDAPVGAHGPGAEHCVKGDRGQQEAPRELVPPRSTGAHSPGGEEFAYPHRQSSGRVQLRAALLPKGEVVVQGNAAAPRPAIQCPHVLDHVRVALQQTQHGRNGAACGIDTPMLAEERLVRLEPGAEPGPGTLVSRGRPIAGEDGLPVVSDGARIGGVVGEWRGVRPVVGQEREATQGERLDQRFLDPLAGVARLGIGLPAVAEHVPQFVPDLVGEIAPVAGADVDDDPTGGWSLGVEPDRWIAAGTVVDAELFGLAIGEQGNSRKTRRAHTLDYDGRVRRRRPAPVAAQFQRCGEQRRARSAGACHGGFQSGEQRHARSDDAPHGGFQR